MVAPVHVKQRADEARQLMSRPTHQEPAPEQSKEPDPPKERVDPTDYKKRFSLLLHSRDERYEQSQAEVDRLTRENDELNRRIAELQPPVESTSYRLSDEERELLGESGASVVESVTHHIDSRLKEQEERERVAEQKAYARFVTQVDNRIPGWREIQKDTAFLTWLEGVDDELKVTRQSLLDRGVELRDAELIGSVFDQYTTDAAGQSNPVHTPSPDLDPRSMESTGDVFEEWFGADEIADHYAEKTKMVRNRRNSGPEWEVVMDRQRRIDDAIQHRRVLKR